MGELYKQALEQEGFQVVVRKNIGGTEVIDEELQDGRDRRLPRVHRSRRVRGRRRGRVGEVGRGDQQAGPGASTRRVARCMSEETPFENTETVAVTTSFAQDNGLRTIEDLREAEDVHVRCPAGVRGP